MGVTPGLLFLPPPPLLYIKPPHATPAFQRRPRTVTLRARTTSATCKNDPPDDSVPSQFGEHAAASIVASAGYVVAPSSAPRAKPLPLRKPPNHVTRLPTPPPPLTVPLNFPRPALHSIDVHGIAVMRNAFASAVGPLSRAAAAQLKAQEYGASVAAIARIVDGRAASVHSATIDVDATDARARMFATSPRALSAVHAALRTEHVMVCGVRLLEGRRFDRLVSGRQAIALYIPIRRRGRDKSESAPQRIRVGDRDLQASCGDAVVVAGEIEWSVTSVDGEALCSLVVTYAVVEEMYSGAPLQQFREYKSPPNTVFPV